MKECINTTMVPFVLPVILLVAERSSKEEFVEHILPHLRQIMKLTEPVQVGEKIGIRIKKWGTVYLISMHREYTGILFTVIDVV